MDKYRGGSRARIITNTLLPLLLFAAALFLRLYKLGDKSLWDDEMFSLNIASSPFTDIQQALVASYHHPPLYFYITKISLAFLGRTAWALRFPSALFGAITVSLLYTIGKRLFSNASGIVAALLCLIAPFHLAYSQEGRPYALAALICLLTIYAFIRFLRTTSSRNSLLYSISILALLYTHHWGVFVLAAQAVIWLVFTDKHWDTLKHGLLAFVTVAVLYMPEFLALRHQLRIDSTLASFWVEPPSLSTLYHLGTAYSGSYFKMASSAFVMTTSAQVVAVILVAALIAFSCYTVVKKNERDAIVLLLCWIAILALPFCESLVRPEVFVWYRYPVIVFPLFCLIVGASLISSILKKYALILLPALLITNLAADILYFSWDKGNAQEVAGYAEEFSQKEVEFLIRPRQFAPLFNYYYTGPIPQYDETYLDQPLGGIIDTANQFAYIHTDVPNIIYDYMEQHFDKVSEKRFPGEAHLGIVIDVYRQKPDTSDDQ